MSIKYVFNPTTGNLDATDKVAFNGEVNAGSAASPSIFFTGDPNTGIYSPGADQLALSTNGTGRLFVDASGNVAVGTSATTFYGGRLTILGGALALGAGAKSVFWSPSDNGSGEILSPAQNALAFNTNSTERLRITSAGLVGIGTADPGSYSAAANQLVIAGANDSGLTIRSGTASSSSIYFADGTAGTSAYQGIIYYSHSSDSLNFHTNYAGSSNPRMVIDSSGRVAIGTTSPSTLLNLESASPFIRLAPTTQNNVSGIELGVLNGGTTAYAKIDVVNTATYDTNLRFFTNTSSSTTQQERVRIDSSGRLLVGTSSASQSFEGGTTIGIQAESTGNGNKNLLRLVSNAVANWSPVLSFARSRGTINGAVTAVVSGDVLGVTSYAGADGTGHIVAAQIFAAVDNGADGTALTGSEMPGRLVFSTTADGAASPTEQLRITSNRYVRLASGTGGIQFNGDTAAANALDDYEEGTFTPGITFGGNSVDLTYTASNGQYTKIGNLVTFRIGIDINSKGTSTGNMKVTGLPFSSASGSYVEWPLAAELVNFTGLTGAPLAVVDTNATTIQINQSSATGAAAVTDANASSGYLFLAGIYHVS